MNRERGCLIRHVLLHVNSRHGYHIGACCAEHALRAVFHVMARKRVKTIAIRALGFGTNVVCLHLHPYTCCSWKDTAGYENATAAT